MPITGLFYLPVPPSTTNSPSAALISHLSHTFPSQPHDRYHVDHLLFVETSSLLPSASANSQSDTSSPAAQSSKSRQYTHLLTTSHNLQSSYIGTTQSLANKDEIIMITIPSFSQDSFTQLLNTKMQAQWAQRQFVVLEGVSVTLPPRHDGNWTVRLGDLRNAGSAAGKATSGSSTNTIRAVLVEVEYQEKYVEDDENDKTKEKMRKYEDLFRGLTKSLFRSVTDLKFEDARLLIKPTPVAQVNEKEKNVDGDKPAGWEVASLYMELLRGPKS